MDCKCTLIHWFRKGLRVHDNPALSYIFDLARASPSKYIIRPIYILDAGILECVRIGGNRWRFLQQSLTDLNAQLEALNSRLYVVRGNPASVFTRLLADWKQLECITYESDIEPYARKHDAMLECLGREHNVEVKQFCSHTVFNPNLVIQKNLGRAPLTYQKFLSLVENINVPEPLDKPEPLPVKLKPPLDPLEAEDSNCYDCPSLHELLKEPFSLGENKYPGGETEALRRLESAMHDERWVCAFEKPKTSPNSLEPSTTVLSPYLSFGCLSARLFYQRISECLRKHPKHSQPPVSLLGQIMWREFYYAAAASEPNFDRMLGNCFCLQIPWQRNDNLLEAWTHGRTGYPFIDAIMRQLRQEGWIHHLARHAVACFLTRGDLWISWEDGQKVFEELLLDQDWALNAGNWMWLSASAFFYKYFRVYSPVTFGKKTDPQGLYIRKYVPELSKYPSKYLYEPWKATLREQREYGCVLGEDYPHRIVNHEVIHKENIKKMSAAYKVNREVRTGKTEGNPDEVMETSEKRKASDIDTGKTTKKRQRV